MVLGVELVEIEIYVRSWPGRSERAPNHPSVTSRVSLRPGHRGGRGCRRVGPDVDVVPGPLQRPEGQQVRVH
eukprot:8886474-Pyramimonas_sp.AAC.1